MKSIPKALPHGHPQTLIPLTLGLLLFPLTCGCSKPTTSSSPQPSQTTLDSNPNTPSPTTASPTTTTSATDTAPDQASSPQNPKDGPNSSNPSLIIEVRGFKDAQGQCRIALYRGKDGFNQPDQAILKSTQPIPSENPNPNSVLWLIDQASLEKALGTPSNDNAKLKLAVSAHHDKNTNDKLDKNPLGIPTEPYGFSQNPKRGFGPPSFEEALFEYPSQTETNSEKSPTRVIIEVR